ncbi:MAG: hypothetical protein V1849_03770 [Chloroflexota bacterium]
MQWEFVIALAVAIPVILFPAALVWYINVGGLYAAIKRSREKRAIARHLVKKVAAVVGRQQESE